MLSNDPYCGEEGQENKGGEDSPENSEGEGCDPINNRLRYFSSNGSPTALGPTEAHGAWVKLVNPHLGPTPLAEIQINTIKYR